MYNYVRAVHYLISMQRRAYLNQEKLQKYQDTKVREIVDYAYHNVPFYHDKIKQLGIDHSEIRSVGDLSKLPVLKRKEISENASRMISKRFDPRKLKIVSTSGSTGRPLFTYLTWKEDEFRKAKHLRANIALGQKLRDRWVVITAPQHFSDVTKIQQVLGVYAATPLSVFDDAETQILALQQMKPDILDGYSSSLFLLAKEVEKRREIIHPRFIIGGAELADASSRQLVENSFEAPFYDQYACVELERLAWQCKEKAGYHIDADSVIMQFLDENCEEVAPGENGEIVCTSLFNYAMPFIRYAVGDVGRLSKDVGCACGRTLPLMEVVEGRKDSFIALPDGRILPPLVFGWIMEFFRFYSSVEHYRIIQKKLGLFRILVKKKAGSVGKEEFAMELSRHIGEMLKVDQSQATFETEFVDEIPLDRTGKFMKVISELDDSNTAK